MNRKTKTAQAETPSSFISNASAPLCPLCISPRAMERRSRMNNTFLGDLNKKILEQRRHHQKLANEAAKRVATSSRPKQTVHTLCKHLVASIGDANIERRVRYHAGFDCKGESPLVTV